MKHCTRRMWIPHDSALRVVCTHRRALSKLPRTFAPLTREDLPKAGDILALDAEFVSLQTVRTPWLASTSSLSQCNVHARKHMHVDVRARELLSLSSLLWRNDQTRQTRRRSGCLSQT
jgi:hypothetical protein